MSKKLTRKQWMWKKRIVRLIRILLFTVVTLSICLVAIKLINTLIENKESNMDQFDETEFVLDGIKLANGVKIKAELLTPNPNSRPQTNIEKLNGIVIHYVGNPQTTAENNRNYFEGLAVSKVTSASSNFIVGLKGEVIQCIPANEVAYCSNNRNSDTLSIEVCHPDETGKFNDKTYESVVNLTAYLCNMFDLTTKDVIRHFDVTKKKCPLYYVDHPDAWEQLKSDVDVALEALQTKESNGTTKSTKR